MKRAMNLTKIILGHPSKADKMKEGWGKCWGLEVITRCGWFCQNPMHKACTRWMQQIIWEATNFSCALFFSPKLAPTLLWVTLTLTFIVARASACVRIQDNRFPRLTRQKA
jgi:hypothetical protein